MNNVHKSLARSGIDSEILSTQYPCHSGEISAKLNLKFGHICRDYACSITKGARS